MYRLWPNHRFVGLSNLCKYLDRYMTDCLMNWLTNLLFILNIPLLYLRRIYKTWNVLCLILSLSLFGYVTRLFSVLLVYNSFNLYPFYCYYQLHYFDSISFIYTIILNLFFSSLFYIMQRHMKSIYRGVASARVPQSQSAFRVLIAMASFNQTTARDLFLSFNFQAEVTKNSYQLIIHIYTY